MDLNDCHKPNNGYRQLSPQFKRSFADRSLISTKNDKVLVELSPNAYYGECVSNLNYERLALSSRLRFSAIELSEKQKSLIEANEDFVPKTRQDFGRYLGLVSVSDLNEKPLTRLQSTHPLRRISRVKIRHNFSAKIDLNPIEISSDLRQKRLKTVENMNTNEIQSRVRNYEIYCGNESVVRTDGMLDKNDGEINITKKRVNAKTKSSRVLMSRIVFCPNCDDYVFNRSKHNQRNDKYHSCRKGRITTTLSKLVHQISL